MARIAEVKKDACIGEAQAKRDSIIKEAMAEEERIASKFLNDTVIAKAERDFKIKKATYDIEVETKKADAELAYELQSAKTKQRIREAEMQIKVVERTQEIMVQEQEILRKERELDSTVRRPAEAEKYRLEELAKADRTRVVLEAEAQAETMRLKSEAKAFAIAATAKAEADQMMKKAEAWKEYKDAAKMDMILNRLSKIATEVAAPLAKAKKVTMIASSTGNIGAPRLTNEIINIVTTVPEMVKTITGVDVLKVK